MIYTNLNRVLENIVERNWLHWRMYQKDGTSIIAECVNLENVTAKKAADYLKEEIENLEGTGYVVVKLYQQPPKQGGNNSNNLTFYIKIQGNEDEPSVKGTSANFRSDFGMISGFYETINGLNMKLLQQENEFKLKELEARLSKKDKSTLPDPTLLRILGVAEAAFNMKAKQAQPEPKPQPKQEYTNTQPINGIPEDKEVFTNSLKNWAKADPDYIEAMKAIVYFAQTDYDTYRFYMDKLIINSKNKTNG